MPIGQGVRVIWVVGYWVIGLRESFFVFHFYSELFEIWILEFQQVVTLRMMKTKPQLSKQAFWDVDFEKLDYEENARFIIERIFERGKLDEILEVDACYSEEFVKDILTTARYLSGDTISFASAFYKIPKESFACYTRKQLHPSAWTL